jgi:hypothetical protein
LLTVPTTSIRSRVLCSSFLVLFVRSLDAYAALVKNADEDKTAAIEIATVVSVCFGLIIIFSFNLSK